MDISVVIPVYNEVEALPELHQTLTDALDRISRSAEIVFVDDGSSDGSAAVLDALARRGAAFPESVRLYPSRHASNVSQTCET